MALLIVEHHGTRRMAPLARRVLIGRRPGNHVVINDRAVSMIHAWVDKRGEECVLTDTGSRTGTLVNGKRITRPLPLVDGDVITVGPATLTFHANDESDTVDPAAIAAALAPAPRAIAVEDPPPPSTVPPAAPIPSAALPAPVAPPPPSAPAQRVDSSADGWLFDCACGAPLWAGASFAGRTAYCRYCGREVRVPDSAAAAAAAAGEAWPDPAELPQAELHQAEPPSAAVGSPGPDAMDAVPAPEVVVAESASDVDEAVPEPIPAPQIVTAEPSTDTAADESPEPSPVSASPLGERAPEAAGDEEPSVARSWPAETSSLMGVAVTPAQDAQPRVADAGSSAAAVEPLDSAVPSLLVAKSPAATDERSAADTGPGVANGDTPPPQTAPDERPGSFQSELNELVSALAAAEQADERRASDAPFIYDRPTADDVMEPARDNDAPSPKESPAVEALPSGTPLNPNSGVEPAVPEVDTPAAEAERPTVDFVHAAEPPAPPGVTEAAQAGPVGVTEVAPTTGDPTATSVVTDSPAPAAETRHQLPDQSEAVAADVPPLIEPSPLAATAIEPVADAVVENAPAGETAESASRDAAASATTAQADIAIAALAALSPAADAARSTAAAPAEPPADSVATPFTAAAAAPAAVTSPGEESRTAETPQALSVVEAVATPTAPAAPGFAVRSMSADSRPAPPVVKAKTPAAAPTAARNRVASPPPARPGKMTPLKASRTCGICQSGILFNEKTTTCPSCGLTFHTDCWTENRGCSAYGCPQVGILDAKKPGATGAATSADDGGDATDDDAAVAAEAAAVEREAAKTYAAKAPFPWEFATLAASAVCLLLSALTFGVPSFLVGTATMIYLSKKPGVRRKTGVLLLSTLIALIGFVGGAMLSWFWYFGSGTGGGIRP